MGKIFAGIDPGQTGGLGIVDHRGGFIAAWRWSRKEPIYIYNKLCVFRELIERVYIEHVRVFPREQKGLITQNQSLLVNSGIWQGWLIALGLPYLQIDPSTWQAAQGLHQWAAKREKNQAQHSPLTLARKWWPTAPLEHQADDGKAVALLLAHLAAKDRYLSIDRAAIQAQAAAKTQARKKAIRQARKAA